MCFVAKIYHLDDFCILYFTGGGVKQRCRAFLKPVISIRRPNIDLVGESDGNKNTGVLSGCGRRQDDFRIPPHIVPSILYAKVNILT